MKTKDTMIDGKLVWYNLNKEERKKKNPKFHSKSITKNKNIHPQNTKQLALYIYVRIRSVIIISYTKT